MTNDSDNTYKLSYNFVHKKGTRTVKSILKICERYGLYDRKEEFQKLVDDIRDDVKNKIGSNNGKDSS